MSKRTIALIGLSVLLVGAVLGLTFLASQISPANTRLYGGLVQRTNPFDPNGPGNYCKGTVTMMAPTQAFSEFKTRLEWRRSSPGMYPNVRLVSGNPCLAFEAECENFNDWLMLHFELAGACPALRGIPGL